MASPAISVVLPVYNGVPYIRESVRSVLTQTFTDFELLVWDDGSTDSTGEALASLRDPRVRRFTNGVNQGLFPTLNLAIAQCRGDLIRLWAQDDRMLPQCLEKETAFSERHPE